MTTRKDECFFENHLDLSEIASSVQDYLHILLADVVIVARRWSHLDKIKFCRENQISNHLESHVRKR